MLPTSSQSKFLESLDSAQRDNIFDVSAQVASGLDEWAARFPLIRSVRVQPLALSVTSAAPFSSVEALVHTARVSLWVFTLDDVFDEERFPRADLMRRAERYRAVALGSRPDPEGDQLVVALQEARDGLAQYPLFASMEKVWVEGVCGTVDGMIREYDWRLDYRVRGSSMLPTYKEYISYGLCSIGGPPHIRSTLITIDDPSTPKHWEYLRSMERTSCTCIRLANDLRSYDKEVREGNFNSVAIHNRDLLQKGLPGDLVHQMAVNKVKADIEKGLDRLMMLQERACTDTGQPESAIANIARFVCEFYSRYDYHTFTQSVN